MPVTSFPLRTLLTYGLLRVPRQSTPKRSATLPAGKTEHFDRNTAQKLASADAIHGIPGQCLKTFTRARELGITTVLNHATGPAKHLRDLLEARVRTCRAKPSIPKPSTMTNTSPKNNKNTNSQTTTVSPRPSSNDSSSITRAFPKKTNLGCPLLRRPLYLPPSRHQN